MNTPTKRVFITVQGGVAYNAEEKSDAEVSVLIIDFDNFPQCPICKALIGKYDAWAFADAYNDFVHAACLHGEHSEPMTDAEYLKFKGLRCPACRRTNITSGEIMSDTSDLSAFAEVECDDCGKVWVDHYTLTSYSVRT
jgi:hypothetical protein